MNVSTFCLSQLQGTSRRRNIGISAHIDAGKTTLSERILFYAGKIRKIGEVHNASAALDTLPLERARGITIQSAATQVHWLEHAINLIDTPGHVDFTVEVERALSVLDGAILVLCGVAGVQAQTLTVDRQIRRHKLPRMVFINKLDRPGADALGVFKQLKQRLDPRACLLNLPLYKTDTDDLRPQLMGVLDILSGQALYFEGEHGQSVRRTSCPQEHLDGLRQARTHLLEALAEVDETILAALLDDREPTIEELSSVLRQATIQGQITPVLCGSAYHQIGVQPLLDAVVALFPAPEQRVREAMGVDDDNTIALTGGVDGKLCAFAFKVDDGRFGQLSYVRVFQGRLAKGMRLDNVRTGERIRVGRLGRMHAATMAEIEAADAGDIVVLFGVSCAHGDTFTAGGLRCAIAPIVVPKPVVTVALTAAKGQRGHATRLAKALGRFTREDPSFQVSRDEESGETLIAGMGELHLDVYVQRLRQEYELDVEVSPPQVAYRESIACAVELNHTHKKQDGGHGQYARVQGTLRPTSGEDTMKSVFTTNIRSGAIPKEYFPACEQGFTDALDRGVLIGAPVLGVTLELNDGATHEKDSSPLAFRIATRDAVRAAVARAEPVVLEPVMEVEVTTPVDHHGTVVSSLVRRRGVIIGHERVADGARLTAHVPLAEMFGYAGDLRSLTQGQGCFSMHFAHYTPVPTPVMRTLVRQYEQRCAR